MKIDYEKYKNIEIDKDKFKNISTNVEHLRNCLAICYILMEEKGKEIERLNTDKEQLNSLVNSCQEEIRRLNNIINKALELIYANAYDTERKECIDDLWGSIEELVDILKGSDKE